MIDSMHISQHSSNNEHLLRLTEGLYACAFGLCVYCRVHTYSVYMDRHQAPTLTPYHGTHRLYSKIFIYFKKHTIKIISY